MVVIIDYNFCSFMTNFFQLFKYSLNIFQISNQVGNDYQIKFFIQCNVFSIHYMK